MKKFLLPLLLLLLGTVLVVATTFAADIEVDSVRKSQYDYACVDVSGNLPLTNHQRFDKAYSVCANRAFADPAGTYEIQGGRWRVSVNVEPTTPPPPPPPPPATNPDVVFQVNVACVPALEGISPNATFDVAQCVTGQGTYTVSADSGWTVNDTVIAAPATGSGMLKLTITFPADNVDFVMSRAWSVL